ncbi:MULTISPECIES: phosphoadenosine phosphosulfate reductase family protein [Psychrobacter]|jgi:phosphoadenosine phosphosulfate reductase|uniref:phosphoadenosine phosphosulfate reductase domain-containing protein n=1 Tax=Psychrobacter TaxID=497 RepID=UPI0004341BC1|nr:MULTISPECIES: phosphoadenosine phosphosulfate reductase family protein [Psychrobacter]MBA6244329.1 phosphoadenosine phosphosulfate reductase family protein [Psychrobacter sp. Urea-trap-18]MBA6286336.1 phosphoadenosine phosphosulfate reductase family protein [Psychrobacter sp. Urea-trap-16]MBA6317697.1 phosphoadenosine phosphosulfate reductase family protein [Psychrobacter sp. Urea-trap-20]MBA6335410.1 phosphoadenosine phosphosulfate reductase family protein [Psychrobacter sp. Urea-trap-19]M|tara:strand:- start:1172 stop:1810 length:639 start_codon:yes stop_codon:yes gene_type:complete
MSQLHPNLDIDQANQDLQGKSPEQIVEWALTQAKNPIITTNFRPYESAILHLVAKQRPDITVLWVDSGYNTDATYQFANKLIRDLDLNVVTYIPKQTAAHRDATMNGIPGIDNPQHGEFTEQVKLEPFRRALAELKPDVWFNAIRKDQTEFRQGLDVLSLSKDGVLKVAPLFEKTDADLDVYLDEHNLPNEHDYFDPTKVEESRECGLHTQL